MDALKKYWAFLSYSHQDAKVCEWLHQSLENFRVPHRLVGRESREGMIPARLFPIFRDRDELPGSSELGKNLTEALLQSRYLIVICSASAARRTHANTTGMPTVALVVALVTSPACADNCKCYRRCCPTQRRRSLKFRGHV